MAYLPRCLDSILPWLWKKVEEKYRLTSLLAGKLVSACRIWANTHRNVLQNLYFVLSKTTLRLGKEVVSQMLAFIAFLFKNKFEAISGRNFRRRLTVTARENVKYIYALVGYASAKQMSPVKSTNLMSSLQIWPCKSFKHKKYVLVLSILSLLVFLIISKHKSAEATYISLWSNFCSTTWTKTHIFMQIQ